MSRNHQYSSWGRTRRPKNILGPDGTIITGVAAGSMRTSPTAASSQDITVPITAVSYTAGSRGIQFQTTSNDLDALLGSGGLSTVGFNSLIDGLEMQIVSANNAAPNPGATVTLLLPEHLTPSDLRTLVTPVVGSLRRRSTIGHRTENAKFLHIWLQDGDANGNTVTVYGYNYAFGRWAPLKVPVGFDTGDAEIADAVGGDVLAVADPVAASTIESSYVNAVFTPNATAAHYILPISGIDKVYFFCNADQADVQVSAAINTF